MNRSYSKIRHIQEVNLRLEERLLNERFNNQQMIIEQSELLEQTEDSSITCSVNISKGPENNIWKTMDPVKREEKLKEIKTIVDQSVKKSIQEYTTWFNNPLTKKKFKTVFDVMVLKKLLDYLNKINKVNLSFEGSSHFKNARAWVTPKEPYTINYNLSQIHDGNNFLGMSIDDTTKHEMGHLIDFFFKRNKVKTYNQTINIDTPESYAENYIVNDADQYTRLNVLRGVINAGPADDPKTLLDKFLKQVQLGKITSNKFNFSEVTLMTGMSEKNDTKKAKEIMSVLEKSIFVDEKNNHNIEELFSNFAFNKGGTIYVSFNLISELNYTSKDINPKYYFLKLSVK